PPRAVLSEQAHLHSLFFVRFLLRIHFRHFYGFGILQLLDDLSSLVFPPLGKQGSVAPLPRLTKVFIAKKDKRPSLFLSPFIHSLIYANDFIRANVFQLFEVLLPVWLIVHLQHVSLGGKRITLLSNLITGLESRFSNADSNRVIPVFPKF